jgi:hypothetical protein
MKKNQPQSIMRSKWFSLSWSSVDDVHLLGAREQPRVGRRAAAGRDRARILEVIGLVGLERAELAGRETREHMRRRLRQQRRRPVFIGEAEPGVGDVEGEVFLLLDLRIGLLLETLRAHFADQALVQNVVAERVRRAVARDQRVGVQRHRRRAGVRHLVLDSEEVFVVDRDGAREGEAGAVVPGERHRVADA